MDNQYFVAVVRAKLAAQAARESVAQARHRLDAAAETLHHARNIHARYNQMLGCSEPDSAFGPVPSGRRRGRR